MSITMKEAMDMYKSITKRFSLIEGKPWKAEGALIELTKQVGELSKCILIQENYYFFESNKEDNIIKLSNELADVFAQVIRIADFYNIDLESAYIAAREEEDDILKSQGV